MAKKQNYQNRSPEELETALRDLNQELFSLRNQLAFERKLEKPHLLKLKRKERARVLTALTQRKAV